MSLLKIMQFPNEKLKEKCSDCRPEKNLHELQKLSEKMIEVIKFYNVRSLAAPQVGISLNVMTIFDENKKEFITMINPKIVKFDGIFEHEEKCVSFPRTKTVVQRYREIEVKYLDENGSEQHGTFEGKVAGFIQHGIDHLQGILFIDRLSKLKKDIIIKKQKKLKGI